MEINQAYIQFLSLVNRNLTNNKINVDKARFILLFNEVSPRFVEWVLEKRNEDVIRDVSILLIPDKVLTSVGSNNSSESYQLPEDFFDFSNLEVFASKGNCKNRKLLVFEIKSDDSEELLSDANNSPSFEFEETFYFLATGNVKIFKKEFDIDRVKITYYRYPKKVDIDGYIHIEDGSASQTIHPEFSDKVTNKILLAMAKQFAVNNSDSGKYALDKDTLFSEI